MNAIKFWLFCYIKRKPIEILPLPFLFVFILNACIKASFPIYISYFLIKIIIIPIIISVMKYGLINFSENELININNAPINRKVVLSFGFLKTHLSFCLCFLGLITGIEINAFLSYNLYDLSFCSLTILNTILFMIIILPVLSGIYFKNKLLSIIIMICYLTEILAEISLFIFQKKFLLLISKNSLLILTIIPFLLVSFILYFREKYLNLIEKSVLYKPSFQSHSHKIFVCEKWNNSFNFMINQSFLTGIRENGSFLLNFPLLFISAFIIFISIGLSQTVDQNGSPLPAEIIIKIFTLLYIFCIGSLWENKSFWRELSFSFMKLIPIKWYHKLFNVTILPFIKILFYDFIITIIIEINSKASFIQTLITFILGVSYILVFMGIYILIFRVTSTFITKENIIITVIRNIANLVYILPGLFLIINNINNNAYIIILLLINFVASLGLFYTGKRIFS